MSAVIRVLGALRSRLNYRKPVVVQNIIVYSAAQMPTVDQLQRMQRDAASLGA